MQHGRFKETWKDRRKDNWKFVGFYVCGATAAGINITLTQLITAAFLSICVAMGTPAIPVAGTTLIVSYKENELDKDVYNS